MRHRSRRASPSSGPGALRREGVALAYARDREDRLVAAASLTEATRRGRAPFTCPGCGDELTPRLGALRARHFAHRPGAACPLTAPETALHFNAKQRLLALCAEAFAGARVVTLLTRCASCRCIDARPLAALGDGAVAEGAVGALRADVLVTRRGAPALALEVLVTHAVDAAKEAALLSAGVPAVEVDARDEWEREGAGAVAEVVCHRTLGLEACPACRALVRAEADRALGGEAAQIAELEAYRARGILRATPTGRPGGADRLLSVREVAGLQGRFRCPECGGTSLLLGVRLLRHACPAAGDRPVAWRGYDGRLAELGWWKK